MSREKRMQRVSRTPSAILCVLAAWLVCLCAVPAGLSATLIVTKLADTNDGICNADCSLREAIALAAPDDIITFTPGLTGTITLGSTLTIGKNVTINGPEAVPIIISGNNAVRVFYVEFGILFTIRNLTVTKGYVKGTRGSNGERCASGAAGGEAQGGGLHNHGGAVAIINSTFSDNRAVGGSGGSGNARSTSDRPYTSSCGIGGSGGSGGHAMGGAIFSLGKLYLVNSTFSGNSVSGGKGGPGGQWGISRGPSVRTGFGGNGGYGMGGALYTANDSDIRSCTFASNSASGATYGLGEPHGMVGEGLGSAIYQLGPTSVQNTIIAGHSGGRNCRTSISSGGYNIDEDGTCTQNAPGARSTINPKLAGLRNNGGVTATHALLPGSPAIDAGNPTGCTDHNGAVIAIDQRGRSRDKRCDIGAFEFTR